MRCGTMAVKGESYDKVKVRELDAMAESIDHAGMVRILG